MFKSTSFGTSFLGSYIYEQLVPQDHPLRILSKVASFSELDEELKDLYSAKGQKAYPPSLMARLSILKDLYNVSDEKVIQMVKENLPARMYAGIGLDQTVPDSSDLTYFRKRLGTENTEKIFNKTIDIAKQNGLKLGDIILIDATHSEAKIKQRTQGKTKDKNHDDKDAVFSYKNKDKTFFGYKHHSSIENNHNLILSVQTTPGNVHDNNKFIDLMEDSLQKANPDIAGADKAYDDKDNHEYLKENNIFSAIILKDTRLRTKDKQFKSHIQKQDDDFEDNHYLKQYFDPRYEKGQKQRYKVEQPYAEMKRYHGLGRSRYLGLEKNQIQAHFTAAVYNLKHIITFIKSSFTTRKLNNAFQT